MASNAGSQISVGGSSYTVLGSPGTLKLTMNGFPWGSITVSSQEQYEDLVAAIVKQGELAFPEVVIEVEEAGKAVAQ